MEGLEEIFGDYKVDWDFDEFNSKRIRTKDFVIDIFKNDYEEVLITLDHHDCFNKVGHNPICFLLSEVLKGVRLTRKGKRLLKAIEILKTKEGKENSNCFGDVPEWEEFGQDIRSGFYR